VNTEAHPKKVVDHPSSFVNDLTGARQALQPTTPTFRDASTDQRGDGCALTVGVVAGGDDNTTGVGDADEPECVSSF
jgi:hypothetical protein